MNHISTSFPVGNFYSVDKENLPITNYETSQCHYPAVSQSSQPVESTEQHLFQTNSTGDSQIAQSESSLQLQQNFAFGAPQPSQFSSSYGSLSVPDSARQFNHSQPYPPIAQGKANSNRLSMTSAHMHTSGFLPLSSHTDYLRPGMVKPQSTLQYSPAQYAAANLIPNVPFGCYGNQNPYQHPVGYVDYSAYNLSIQTSGTQPGNMNAQGASNTIGAVNQSTSNGARLQPTSDAQSIQTSVPVSMVCPSTEKQAGNNRTSNSPPLKRPRGRPRKHPLPFAASLQNCDNFYQKSLVLQGPEKLENQSSISIQQLLTEHPCEYPVQQSGSSMETNERERRRKKKKENIVLTASQRHDKINKYLHYRKELHSNDVFDQLQLLESKPPQNKIAEEFYGFGGAFELLSLGQKIQNVIDAHQNLHDEDDEQRKDKTSNGTSSPNSITTLHGAFQGVLQGFSSQCKGFLLNESFIFSSLNCKLPVRDLVTSRNHMAVLCDDGNVFLYRHKTHPLVRTLVSRWERMAALDGLGVVCIRLASANMPSNWRRRFHEKRRPFLIEKIRRKLIERNVSLPSQPLINSENLLSPEELEFFMSQDPEGILCCSWDQFDPDWLPEPVVLTSLDCSGTLHLLKCCGYYNYPKLVKIEGNLDLSVEPVGGIYVDMNPEEQKENVEQNTKDLLDKNLENDVLLLTGAIPTASSKEQALPESYRIEKNSTQMDIVEKHPDLTVLLNDGITPSKVKAQIQDVYLGELSEEFLESQETSMIICTTTDNQYSVFVKGASFAVRFKNFPTDIVKMYCGPLGLTGAVLLSNKTLFSWKAGIKGSETKYSACISQLGGSLRDQAVVDFMGLGAEYVALTSDGVIHEWNCYEPYLERSSNVPPENIVPQCMKRPTISEPIEWTPEFQSKLMRPSTKRSYRKGHFSWTAEHKANISHSIPKLENDLSMDLLNCASLENSPDNAILYNARYLNHDLISSPALQSLEGCRVSSLNNQAWDPDMESSSADFRSEEILERYRQEEIQKLYKSSSDTGYTDQRIYLLEGVTFAKTQKSGDFCIFKNDLANHNFGEDSFPFTSSQSEFSLNAAHQIRQRVKQLGNLLSSNPVIVAQSRMDPDTVGNDKRLKEELEKMAMEASNPYRLILAPNNVVVAVLKKIDMTQTRRTLLLSRPSTLIAADDPELLFDSMTCIRPPKMTKPASNSKNPSCKNDQPRNAKRFPEAANAEKAKLPRRKNRKVGRPKSSTTSKRATIQKPEQAVFQKTEFPASEENAIQDDEPQKVQEQENGTRKRLRRRSQTLNQKDFFVPGFYDTADSDVVDEEKKTRKRSKKHITQKRTRNNRDVKELKEIMTTDDTSMDLPDLETKETDQNSCQQHAQLQQDEFSLSPL